MTQERSPPTIHPAGGQLAVAVTAASVPVTLDTFAGSVTSPLTPLGQIVFFVEFLKISGRPHAAIGAVRLCRLASSLGRAKRAQRALTGLAWFLPELIDRAQQLTDNG